MLHRSRNSGREFAGWNQLPCGPVLTPNISCTKLKIHLAHADSPIVPEQNYRLLLAIWMQGQSMLHRSRNSGREFAGRNQLSCGPVLTPISCTNLKIHLAHADSTIVPEQNYRLLLAIWMQGQSMLHRSRNSGREFAGWNQLPCGPVLTPISCAKLKIHSAHEDSLVSPKRVFKFCVAILDVPVGPVYASQIKKLRKRICRVEPTPLWASSYTHLLYKAQDPFSIC